MAAHQAPLSLGFSRQEHWSGLPFPSPMHESGKWKVKVKSLSRVRLLATPWTAAQPGSSVHGIFQARVLEWGAIAFSSWMPTGLRNSHLEGWNGWWLWHPCLLIWQEILHFSKTSNVFSYHSHQWPQYFKACVDHKVFFIQAKSSREKMEVFEPL